MARRIVSPRAPRKAPAPEGDRPLRRAVDLGSALLELFRLPAKPLHDGDGLGRQAVPGRVLAHLDSSNLHEVGGAPVNL